METVLYKDKRGVLTIDSDPTYEAWKQVNLTCVIFRNLYSDPTYEAWKLAREEARRKGTNEHSDPTYEAWKLKNGIQNSI